MIWTKLPWNYYVPAVNLQGVVHLWGVWGNDIFYMVMFSRWWFQTFLIFYPYLWRWFNLTDVFQMGWNHQLASAVWGKIFTLWLFGRRHKLLTLPETNSSQLKMDGWKMKCPFGKPYFQGKPFVLGNVFRLMIEDEILHRFYGNFNQSSEAALSTNQCHGICHKFFFFCDIWTCLNLFDYQGT